MKFLTFIFAFILSFSSFGVETLTRHNGDGCIGVMLNFIHQDTSYVTFRDLPEKKLPDVVASPLSEKRISTPYMKYVRSFVKSLISKEVMADSSKKPISHLDSGKLYTFVMTDKEIRFATTSRGKLSLKNLASKHNILANGDSVHFAGEAWFEEGVLVINHNSGTYRPNAAYLDDVALYFQRNLGANKVIFTDLLPEIEANTAVDYADAFKGFLKSRVSTVSEGIVNLFAKDRYLGQVVSMGLDKKLGTDITFSVSDFIGAGTLGVVHKITDLKVSEAAKKAYPELMDGALIKSDLVVKFPHNVPLLKYLPVEDLFDAAIMRESDEIGKLKEIIKEFDQEGADILLTGESNKRPFLIKNLVKASSVQSMAEQTAKLSKEQEAALKRDIYRMAEVVKEKMGLNLDIKAENVAWDNENKKFIMYELSIKQTNSFFLTDGFDGYLSYFNKRMVYWGQKRKPASSEMETFNVCSKPSMEIPRAFKHNYTSELYEGDMDFRSSALHLYLKGIHGCFSVKEVGFVGNQVQMNIILHPLENPAQELEFAFIKSFATDEVSLEFATRLNHKELSESILQSAKEN